MKTANLFNHIDISPVALGNAATMEPEVVPAGRNARIGSTAEFATSESSSAAVERIAHFRPARLRTLLVPLDGSDFGERCSPWLSKSRNVQVRNCELSTLIRRSGILTRVTA